MFTFYTKFLQPVAFLLYLISFFIYRRYQTTKDTQALYVYYVITTALHTFIGIAAYHRSKWENIWLYEIGAALTSLFVSYHFYRLLTDGYKKKAVLVLVIVYLLYALMRQFTIRDYRLFDSIGYSLLSASVAVYVFMYFHQVLKNVSEVSILKDFNFWLSSSYLLYFVGSIIIFLNYHRLTLQFIKTYSSEERHLLMALWGLHNALLFLSALSLLTGSLWISYRRKLT
ncbi:MAG TPA: hypothetical protein VER36_08325 [Flavisolibacter sp.]|nr:hypothetical protein [Flavisolibacter sp.]